MNTETDLSRRAPAIAGAAKGETPPQQISFAEGKEKAGTSCRHSHFKTRKWWGASGGRSASELLTGVAGAGPACQAGDAASAVEKIILDMHTADTGYFEVGRMADPPKQPPGPTIRGARNPPSGGRSSDQGERQRSHAIRYL